LNGTKKRNADTAAASASSSGKLGAATSGGWVKFLRDQTHREFVYRPLQFQKRRQLFVSAHNESLSVPMRVGNPDRSPLLIDG